MMDCKNNVYKENFMKKIIVFLNLFLIFDLGFFDLESVYSNPFKKELSKII